MALLAPAFHKTYITMSPRITQCLPQSNCLSSSSLSISQNSQNTPQQYHQQQNTQTSINQSAHVQNSIQQQSQKKITFYDLNLKLPEQDYRMAKVVPIPFDGRECNNGRFASLNDAMLFIGKHCYFHHSGFTKPLAKMYLPFCRVMRFVTGAYETPSHLKKADFETAFNFALQKIGLAF